MECCERPPRHCDTLLHPETTSHRRWSHQQPEQAVRKLGPIELKSSAQGIGPDVR